MSSVALTTRVDSELKAELQQIAELNDRSTSYMANQAIRNLVEEHRATRELLGAGLDMIDQDAPSIEAQAVHEWFMADEDVPFPKAET